MRIFQSLKDLLCNNRWFRCTFK